MIWKNLTSEDTLEQIKIASKENAQVIFKHSTRCSISTMAKSRLERADSPTDFTVHYLDLLEYRNISNKIAEDFDVEHASPQIIIIKNGECIYDESHNGISMDEILEQLN
jgi:bacillithiol system protein YtxJ